MKEEIYWQQFCRTGRVNDYLSYLKQKQDDKVICRPEKEGEQSGAESMQRYRNDIEGGTFRGI